MDIELKGVIDGKETTLIYRREEPPYFSAIIFFTLYTISCLYVGMNQAWPNDMPFLFWVIPKIYINWIISFMGIFSAIGLIMILNERLKSGELNG